MTFSFAPLLIHSQQIPARARHALRAAFDAPHEQRTAHLELAASILHREMDVDCRDARELVGLSAPGACF